MINSPSSTTKLTAEKDVIELMSSSKSEEEWNTNADKVQKAFNGYPDFWYPAIIQSGIAQQVAETFGKNPEISISVVETPLYVELGKKEEITPIKDLKQLDLFYGRPTSMPYLEDGYKVICGYDQGLGEKMFICNTVEGMQQLFDGYSQGGALSIKWYSGIV